MEAQIILMLGTTPTPIQLSQTSHDNQMLYLGRPGQSNSDAPNISCQEDTQIIQEEEDDDWGTLIPTLVHTMLTHRRCPPESSTTDLSWNLSAQLRGFLPKSSTRLGVPPASTS